MSSADERGEGNLNQPVLLAIDGNSLSHRAFHGYAKTELRSSSGAALWAVYGFVALMVGICEKVNPSGLVVGFDDSTSSVRKSRCPEYKAQRVAKDQELYDQIDSIIALLGEIGVTVLIPNGLEADDVVASCAHSAESEGWRCVVATSDRDSFGLISKATSVLRLGSGLDNAMLIGPGELRERYGVGADQYLDYAALRGDSSDNLVGIRGVGERTAAKLLDRFGTLDAALDDASGLVDCVGPRLAGLLTSDDGRATITKNRDIMALTRNLLVDLGGCRLPLDQSLVAESLGRYELDKLISRAISQMCAPVLGDVEAYADEPYDRAIDETEIELLIREAEAADRLAGGVVVPEHIRAWDDNTLF